MADSTTAADIPPDVDIVAGYIDGPYAWSQEDWARFGDKPRVMIATRADTHGGNCLDVETGDATPDDAPRWATIRRGAGAEVSVYCNLSTWPTVSKAFRSAGVAEPHYWVAHWDGSTDIPGGAVAKQYEGSAQTGGHWDASVALDVWGGVDHAPAPAPAPAPVPEPVPVTTYVVASGDTLSGIAEHYGITWEALWEANKGEVPDPNRIYPGQRLIIP